MTDERRRIVFDLKLARPACALLQAIMGGSPGIANMFPSEIWLTSMTNDLCCYAIDEDDLKKLVKRCGGLYRTENER